MVHTRLAIRCGWDKRRDGNRKSLEAIAIFSHNSQSDQIFLAGSCKLAR